MTEAEGAYQDILSILEILTLKMNAKLDILDILAAFEERAEERGYERGYNTRDQEESTK